MKVDPVQETNLWHMPSVTWALDHGNSLDIVEWIDIANTDILPSEYR
jgi:hypothetical protein